MKVNLFHFSFIYQWKTILRGPFKITLNVVIWFQVSKTLITFERRCLNDIPSTYIQFVLLRQPSRKTFSDRNTMCSLIWYGMNIFCKANYNLLEKETNLLSLTQQVNNYIYIPHWHLLCFLVINSPVDRTYLPCKMWF